MTTNTNTVRTKPVKTKSVRDRELMYKTISSLTEIVTKLENDVKRIKIRIGI